MRTILLSILIAASCIGCMEAPQPVRDNSKLERDLWVRYAKRTQLAIETRNSAIRKIGAGWNEATFQQDLAELNKLKDATGNGSIEKAKAWVLDSIAQKDARRAKIEKLIAQEDAKIAQDMALVNAALGLHESGQEWLDTGVGAEAIDSVFDFAKEVVPALKPKDVGGK
jgi:hypothetical protein